MSFKSLFMLAVIGAALAALVNAKDIQRYLKLRNM